jgi:hypothetical protein
MPLPTFLVIGAQKCGTSSLHNYLALHPDIEMPGAAKELDFFLDDTREESWYAAQWRGGTPVRGEASPNYTNHPFHDGVPARAAALVPEAKLVYLVRDPIDRVVSHYVHRRAQNLERRPLETVLADLSDNGLVHRSRYMSQLDRWLERYPPDRVLVVVSERLRARRDETLDRIYAFVGAAPGFRDEGLAAEHLTAGERRELSTGGLALERAPAARVARGLLPERLRRPLVARLRAGLSREVPVPTVAPELRERLEAVLREDVERLRAFTGDPLPEWSL